MPSPSRVYSCHVLQKSETKYGDVSRNVYFFLFVVIKHRIHVLLDGITELKLRDTPVEDRAASALKTNSTK